MCAGCRHLGVSEYVCELSAGMSRMSYWATQIDVHSHKPDIGQSGYWPTLLNSNQHALINKMTLKRPEKLPGTDQLKDRN